MKTTINKSEFVEAFDNMNRSENFSRAGRESLFDYLEQYEQDCGTEIELDVIALCCEYSEYDNFAEFQKDYNGYNEYTDITDIEQVTTVIRIDDESFIIQQF